MLIFFRRGLVNCVLLKVITSQLVHIYCLGIFTKSKSICEDTILLSLEEAEAVIFLIVILNEQSSFGL